MAVFPPATINMPLTSSPPTSILKSSKTASHSPAVPSMAGQKRKMMDMDISSQPSSSSAPSDAGSRDGPSAAKRARVQFDDTADTVRIHRSEEDEQQPKEKSVSLIREEIRRAIQRHVSGAGSEGYDQIKEVFTADPKQESDEDGPNVASPTSIKRHLQGMLSNVAALNRDCSGLVHAVLSSEWLGRDNSYVKLFIRFLGNLSATHTAYFRPALKMLVSYFAEVPKGTGKLPGYATVLHAEMYDRVHMALRYLLQLLPAGSSTISTILGHLFPLETDSAKANIYYTRNLIKLIEYAPELRSDILALFTEKLVKIDVQIQVDMEEFEDEVGEDLLDELARPIDFNALDEEDDSDAESVISNDDSVDVEARRLQTVKDNIFKMDAMIDQLFEFYSPAFHHSSTDDEKNNTLDLLLSHFVSFILPTYRSRHTQFLIFHFSQCSPDLVERFAATCMHIIDSKTQPAIMRQSAAAYLGSFVARGKHVSSRVVRDIFELLGENLNNLRNTYEASCRGPDLRRYGPFYASTQAILYIFCFRWRDLTTTAEENDNDGLEEDEDLDLEDVTFPPSIKEILHRAIHSRFNPLKVCSPAIVTEFARIAHHLRFMYVYSILESNKRLRMSTFRSITTLSDPRFSIVEREIRAGNDGGDQLDAYFPFDPYQLPRSRRWLEGDYIEWRGVPGLDDQAAIDDDDSDNSAVDDDDNYDNEEEDDDDPTATDEE